MLSEIIFYFYLSSIRQTVIDITSELSFFTFLSRVSLPPSRPNFGEPCVLVLVWRQKSPSISLQSKSAIGLSWWESATIAQMFRLPKTFWGGILFQLMVFIFAFGAGVSCWGNNLTDSFIFGSGVCGRFDTSKRLHAAENRLGGAGGGGAGGAQGMWFPGIASGGGGGGGAAGGGGGGSGGAAVFVGLVTLLRDELGGKWRLFGVCGTTDCLRLGLVASVRQFGHVNFWMLGALRRRTESSLFSRSVARCTSFSAVSHIISLIVSFGSIRKRCWSIFKNGISWGVSATWKFKKERKKLIS